MSLLDGIAWEKEFGHEKSTPNIMKELLGKLYQSGLLDFFGSYDNNMLSYLEEEHPLRDGIIVMDLEDNQEISTEQFIKNKLNY